MEEVKVSHHGHHDAFVGARAYAVEYSSRQEGAIGLCTCLPDIGGQRYCATHKHSRPASEEIRARNDDEVGVTQCDNKDSRLEISGSTHVFDIC